MSQLATSLISTQAPTSAATDKAQANVLSNLTAIRSTQPSIASSLAVVPARLAWLFARDGSLTATVDGKWWADNSLPTRSASEMLKDVTGDVAVSCVVAPVHSAQLRVLLDKIQPSHALIVIQPDASAAHVAMHCEDLS